MKPWSGVGAAYAESYASLCAGTTEAILAALAQSAQRGRLLDVGSGTGALAGAAAAAGWAVTWCEPEATMREVAVADHPDIDVVEGAPPALTFPDAAFDAVIANFVLNHVPDPRASAREMLRVAAPDATMLAEGGWRDVQTTEQTWTWPATREALWRSAEGGAASAGAFYLALDTADRARFTTAFADVCDERGSGGAIPLEHTAAIAVARAG